MRLASATRYGINKSKSVAWLNGARHARNLMRDEPEPHQPARANQVDASFHAGGQDPVQELLVLLELEYHTLLRRLSSHLGSADIAAEALHEVYLKLRSEPSIGELRSPVSYLYRMAINLAKDRGRKDWRTVQIDDAVLEALPDSS
jgi:DNA-directed RNA polymerase specialized sigma24 family protein